MLDRAADDNWIGKIDSIVADVIHTMLRQDCSPGVESPPTESDISATIMLTGSFDAQCVLDLPPATARKMTNAMLRSDSNWEDSILEDAAGELCNMIAGGWKRGLKAPGSTSDLSTPLISRGHHHATPSATQIKLRKTYAFEDSPFTVSLVII